MVIARHFINVVSLIKTQSGSVASKEKTNEFLYRPCESGNTNISEIKKFTSRGISGSVQVGLK